MMPNDKKSRMGQEQQYNMQSRGDRKMIARWKAGGRFGGDATHPFSSRPLPLRSSPSVAAVDVAILSLCAFSSRAICSGCDVVTAMDRAI